jgi:hypothetical protein
LSASCLATLYAVRYRKKIFLNLTKLRPGTLESYARTRT